MAALDRGLGPRPSVTHSPMFEERSATRRWQAYALDALSLRFVVASRNTKGPLLDFGCNEGLTSSAALARGARMVAVDSEESCIDRLIERVPLEHRHRLRTQVADFLEVRFEDEEFEAIHAARSLQYFKG